MIKKYKFTGKVNAYGLKQIIRISDGLVGGWIESEYNLSQAGKCFVYGNAEVFGNAYISGNAKVFGNTYVSGNAKVFGNAEVFGNAYISGNAKVFGNAKIFGDTYVSGNAKVSGENNTDNSSDKFPELLNNLPAEIESVEIKGQKYIRKTIWEKV